MKGNARALKGVHAGALLAASPAIPDGVHFVRLVGSRGKRYNVPLYGTSWNVDRPTAAQADADLANGYGVGVVPFSMGYAGLDVDKGAADALIRDYPLAALYETRPAKNGKPARVHLWYRHEEPLGNQDWYSSPEYGYGGQLRSANGFLLLREIPEWLAQLELGLGGPFPAHLLRYPTSARPGPERGLYGAPGRARRPLELSGRHRPLTWRTFASALTRVQLCVWGAGYAGAATGPCGLTMGRRGKTVHAAARSRAGPPPCRRRLPGRPGVRWAAGCRRGGLVDVRHRLEHAGTTLPQEGGRMKMLPEYVAELDPNIRGTVKTRLQIFDDVFGSSHPDDFGTGEPSIEEAGQRIRSAVERKDGKAEDGAIEDYQTAELGALWQDFPERKFLAKLYERDALWRAKSGTLEEKRRPTHSEGVRLAKALLADFPKKDKFDAAGEADTVARVLAGQGPFSNILPSRRVWREYIKGCRSIRVFFDALNYIYAEMRNRGRAIPSLLARWRKGRLKPPAMKHIPNHPPTDWALLAREIQIQFTIEVLKGVGVPFRGRDLSGCRIVAEALKASGEKKMSESHVEHIWKRCIWRTSFLPMMQKYPPAIAKRHGLDRTRRHGLHHTR